MKKSKKQPIKQLEKFSTIFTQVGLVLVLFIVYVSLEHRTETKPLNIGDYETISTVCLFIPDEQDVIITRAPEELPKIEIPKPDILILDTPIEKGSVETIIFKEPEEQDIAIFNEKNIISVPDPEPEPESDVPFFKIEDAPIFNGCEGLSKELNKICFEKKIKKFVQRNFDVELAQEIGLHSGKYKILTQFIIDKTGEIVDLRIKAPHISLKKEVERIISKIPKFTPGKQRNKPVKIRYTLPIAFRVE